MTTEKNDRTNTPTPVNSSAPPLRSIARGTLASIPGWPEIECHVLDDERRVISARGVVAALTASGVKDGNSERRIERILGENSGIEVGPRIRFTARGGTHVGYPAELLPKLCGAITDRALEGKLHHKQQHIAAQARRIEKALAGVGIVALVDEATGYQTRRAPDALSRLFAEYLLPEPGEWSRAIPEDLYVSLARLYRHAYTAGQARRPLFFRSWTWQFVYGFLPSDVRSELQSRNPNPHAGRTRHHQHLTARAREVLTAHLIRLNTVVRQSASAEDFRMRFDAEFRGGPLQLSLAN
jgi:hypothetical protein